MIKSKIYNYSKEELQQLLDKSHSYLNVLNDIGLQGGTSYKTLKRIIKEYNLDTTKFENNCTEFKNENAKKQSLHNNKKDIQSYLHNESKITGHKLKKKLIEAGLKEEKCEYCGLTEWLDNPIKLHLHHKDGNHNNNELENLELLCPNCHAYTDNFGVYNSDSYIKKKKEKKVKIKLEKYNICPICNINLKNRRAQKCMECSLISRKKDLSKIVSREDLKKLIRTKSFLSIGELYGVTDNSIRKWCKKYNLPSKKTDINNYNDTEWESL